MGKRPSAHACSENGLKWFLFGFQDLGAVLGFKSRVAAVFALLEPAQMVPLLEGQLASPQEPQKIHRFTMPQHGKYRA